MADVREHVRRPHPPWRKADDRTECGRPASDVRAVTSREEFLVKLKAQGVTRAAMTTCMTCLTTARDWPTFEQDPVRAIHRETYSNYGGRQVYGGEPVDRFRNELLALAELVRRHRDEYDAILTGLRKTVRLADHRQRRAGQ